MMLITLKSEMDGLVFLNLVTSSLSVKFRIYLCVQTQVMYKVLMFLIIWNLLKFFMANVFIDYSGRAVQGVEKG